MTYWKLLALILLSGCVTYEIRGYPLEREKVDQIEVGQTTKEEILTLFGSPTVISTFDDNLWYYIGQRTQRRAFFDPTVLEALSIALLFNMDGVVIALEEEDDLRDVAFASQTTPTKGHDINLFQILFANLGIGVPQNQDSGP